MTTTTPTTNNYTLGSGELFFDQMVGSVLTGERYVGNTSALDLTYQSQTLDHYDDDHGMRELDAQVVMQLTRTGSFSADNISMDNIAIFFAGQKETVTTASSTVTAEPFATVGATPGLFYQLGVSLANPTGVRNVSAVAVKVGAATLVADTDYTLDAALGRITPIAGGALAGVITATVGYTVAVSTRDRVVSGNDQIKGALRFIANNMAGEQIDYYMPQVVLSPSGSYALKDGGKSNGFATMQFNISVQKPGDGRAALYADGRPVAA